MTDRWDDLRADLEPEGVRHSMVRTAEVRALLAERDALAAEVERLRVVLDSLSMQWLNEDGQWINVRAIAGKRGALGTRWIVYDSDDLEWAPDEVLAAAPTEEDDR